MTSGLSQRLLAYAAIAALAGCPTGGTQPVPDAGAPDAGQVAPPACSTPETCRAQGFDGVCRAGTCRADVPCGDDAECGLGESCEDGQCRFTGCVTDDDCPAGTCRTDVYACTECGSNGDCPHTLPVCSAQGRCVACQADSDCRYPGPAYCDLTSGACVHCQEDDHCPQGLTCGPDGICQGAQKGQFCDTFIACDLGLTCVNVGSNTMCLQACNLYVPTCPGNEICIKLTFQDSPSLVFDNGAPVGVCYPPVQGARGYHEPCVNNCQPNLACVPDSAAQSTCKAYCDPANPLCAPNELCHPFPGDFSGHEYGLCYPDTGYADPCDGEAACRTGLSCVPRDDPAALTDVSNACAFDVGPGDGLAPCSQDDQCGSGTCRGDPSLGTQPFFCFAACDDDGDCAMNGRTGFCDADFSFTTPYVTANVRGCLPGCEGPQDCAAYGAGATTCRLALDTATARAVQTCGPQAGAKAAGEPCVGGFECRSNSCLRRDGRGVFRQGLCAPPCEADLDCAVPAPGDGGTAPALVCEAAALFLHPGSDGQLNTADDVHAPTGVCGGAACAVDADCQAPFAHCVPQPDPANPLGNLVTVCRTATQSGTLVAGDACVADTQCRSGVCAELGTTGQRTCLQACQPGGTDCGTGLTCAAGGVRVRRGDGTHQTFDACVP